MRSACFLSGPSLINRLQDNTRSLGITSQVSPPGLCSWPTTLPCSYYDPLAPPVPLFPQIRYAFPGRWLSAIAKGSAACFPLLPQWQNFSAGHQVIHIMTTHPSFLCRQRGPDTKLWLKLHKKCLSAWQFQKPSLRDPAGSSLSLLPSCGLRRGPSGTMRTRSVPWTCSMTMWEEPVSLKTVWMQSLTSSGLKA